MGKQREVVAGGGDCQYLALVAAGTEKGLQLGSMLEARVLVHQTLTADPERYMPWVAEAYWVFVAKVLQLGTWGDYITLQAFCDSTGFALKVYCIGVDVDAEDLALRHHMKTPYYDENPHIILEICTTQVRGRKRV